MSWRLAQFQDHRKLSGWFNLGLTSGLLLILPLHCSWIHSRVFLLHPSGLVFLCASFICSANSKALIRTGLVWFPQDKITGFEVAVHLCVTCSSTAGLRSPQGKVGISMNFVALFGHIGKGHSQVVSFILCSLLDKRKAFSCYQRGGICDVLGPLELIYLFAITCK